MKAETTSLLARESIERVPVPPELRSQLASVAQRVFWWGDPLDWLDDATRFTAQVMTYGDHADTLATLRLLGDAAFLQVLADPPPGVFDIKSWTYWRNYYHLPAAPLPSRRF